MRWSPGTVPRGEVVRAVVVPYVLSRLLVGVALGIVRHVVDQLGVADEPPQVDQGLTGWDAAFYADIARGGYDAVPAEGLRFFPLVPLVARAIAVVPGVDARLGVVVVANASALALGFVLYALAWRERGDEAFARRAVWLVYLAPPSFVLVMGYAEATFMTLAVVALLGSRSRRWWLAAGAGFAAGLTRPLGLLLAVPAAVEAMRGRRNLTRREVAARVGAVVAPAAGVAAYLVWASDRAEDFLYPLRVQEEAGRRGRWRFPVANVVDAARDAGTDRPSAAVHVAAALLLAALVVVLARRWPPSYTAYAVVALGVALGASNLDSLERYSLSTVPFVLAAADVTGGPERERVVLAATAAALVAAAVLAFTGSVVP